MAKRHVMIAMPVYTGMVHTSTMRSLLSDAVLLASSGWAITLNDQCGNTLIDEARSECVHLFLQSGATDLVFVDWDVCWPPGSMKQILDHPVDVVGGIYPKRQDPIEFNVRTREEGAYPVDPATGLIDVLGLHAGFLRITRKAALAMVDHYRDALTYDRNGKQIVHLFERYRVPGTTQMLGEDYSFCQRWIDMGGKCWLDPGFQMGHIGLKMYVGQFGKFVAQPEKDAA